MQGEVLIGQLTYIDSEEGQIQIMDRADGQVTALDIDAHTRLPASYGWESLVGEDVEAVAIDGRVKSISLLAQE